MVPPLRAWHVMIDDVGLAARWPLSGECGPLAPKSSLDLGDTLLVNNARQGITLGHLLALERGHLLLFPTNSGLPSRSLLLFPRNKLPSKSGLSQDIGK